jgi:hypothetical protein
VLTEVFRNLGATTARARGYAALRTLVLPHPVESLPEAEVRALARGTLDEIVRLLTHP